MALESNRRLMSGSVLAAVLIGTLILVSPSGMSSDAMIAAALILFAIVFWAIESLPGHLTALVFFILAVLCGVSPGVVFSGFVSGGLWLAFSGLVLGGGAMAVLYHMLLQESGKKSGRASSRI